MSLDGTLVTKLRTLREHLRDGLIEREEVVHVALLAMLAREHVVLIGPPGTAKSMIAQRLTGALADATCFERLLTRFTTPDELFGPFSIQGLSDDRYERLTGGYLPSADVVFLDEIFKANSAILNALLTLLNERRFDNGPRRVETSLKVVVAASNEVPPAGELDALYDRFLFRIEVGPVSDERFGELLALDRAPEWELSPHVRLTSADLDAVANASRSVVIPPDVEQLLYAMRRWCAEQEISVSDRRWRKIVGVLKTAAAVDGRDAVTVWDCCMIAHCIPDLTRVRSSEVLAHVVQMAAGAAAVDLEQLTQWVIAVEQGGSDGRPTTEVPVLIDGEPAYDIARLMAGPWRSNLDVTNALIAHRKARYNGMSSARLRQEWSNRGMRQFAKNESRLVNRLATGDLKEPWSEKELRAATKNHRVDFAFLGNLKFFAMEPVPLVSDTSDLIAVRTRLEDALAVTETRRVLLDAAHAAQAIAAPAAAMAAEQLEHTRASLEQLRARVTSQDAVRGPVRAT